MRGLALGFVVLAAACGGDGTGGDDGLALPDAPGGGTATMFGWTLRQSGQVTTCQAVGATEVWLDIKDEGGQPHGKTFQCVLSPGTVELPPGRYAVKASLYRPSEGIVEAPQQAVTVPVNGVINFAFSM